MNASVENSSTDASLEKERSLSLLITILIVLVFVALFAGLYARNKVNQNTLFWEKFERVFEVRIIGDNLPPYASGDERLIRMRSAVINKLIALDKDLNVKKHSRFNPKTATLFEPANSPAEVDAKILLLRELQNVRSEEKVVSEKFKEACGVAYAAGFFAEVKVLNCRSLYPDNGNLYQP